LLKGRKVAEERGGERVSWVSLVRVKRVFSAAFEME
jgi:hypothetical protein